MKLFNEFLNSRKSMQPMLEDIYRSELIVPVFHGGRLGFDYTALLDHTPPGGLRVSREEWEHAVDLSAKKEGDCLTLWALSGLVTDGVKVFTPSKTEFEALSHTEVNLPVTDYRQPFRTYAIIIPEGVAFQIGESFISPYAVIARHDSLRGVLGLLICYSLWAKGTEKYLDRSCVMLPMSDDVNLEDLLDRSSISQGKQAVMMRECIRIVFNTGLLFTRFGVNEGRYSNPDYASKLTLKIKQGSTRHRELNERELRAIPMVYSFAQTINLFRHEDDGERGDGTGSEVTPHWRKGHWRHQVCGVGGKDRKLIFIPAVLVNSHRFGGELRDTHVTMTT